MHIQTLGASGGIESREGTTAFLLAPNLLLDAGTGTQQLTPTQMACIDTVLLTHAHLDHIASLPLLIDTQYERLVEQEEALTVYALPEVIETLKRHIFNGAIWPDFSTLPSSDNAVLRFSPLTHWDSLTIPTTGGESLTITPFPVSHSVPACGYLVSDDTMKFAFSGDTGLDVTLTQSLNRLGALDCLIIECAFANHLDALAEVACHLTPDRLAALLATLESVPKALWVTHLKPNLREQISTELRHALPDTLAWSLPS
ncbi:3',5'-cyclic-nucleotide phosphodiesterase [Billgrantia montanilacus]|uniref:3',5'-cyclic-nucleotide phosphodiesterase n=1 Tax=Billgrantia montanilacus TaxID=2282305 RepID=A0A368U2S3_9GAMM|nr:3',5'-cyclic-nucleotide phosphodiesterase [Halomonas montanilacus]RCV90856.1 3',5'-cyclic-nucleotide phosphodiesterase [Halomonas montanilacus]